MIPQMLFPADETPVAEVAQYCADHGMLLVLCRGRFAIVATVPRGWTKVGVCIKAAA